MSRFSSGKFTPKNPEKYIGNNEPTYRSSWELAMMRFLDENKNITRWGSEVIKINYRHPVTGQIKNYIPDFFVVYIDKMGKENTEIVEIKPRRQSIIEGKQSVYEKLSVAINHSKWKACAAYCQAHGFRFRVINEQDLFHQGRS